jgi:NAD(P)H-hydrate epimerase|tara:strand:- start:15616 stop:16191 length:576 start_codon:yes stop_codon:yes gene_type:complete
MINLEANSDIPRIVLMENAGKQVYQNIKEKFGLKDKRILVVCYHGNNGGDGFVAARHLCDEAETDVLFVGDENKLKNEALANYRKIGNNAKIQFIDEYQVDYGAYDIIIDAIFGIGFKGELGRDISAILEFVNESKASKVAIDIPTGIYADSAEIKGKYVNADLIITFHDLKKSLEQFQDKTIVADIGITK